MLPEALVAGLRLGKLPHNRWTARLGESIGARQGVLRFSSQAIEQMDAERWEPAIAILQQAIAADPNRKPPHRMLAEVYLNQGKSTEAIKLLEDWLRQQPDRADAHMKRYSISTERSICRPRRWRFSSRSSSKTRTTHSFM